MPEQPSLDFLRLLRELTTAGVEFAVAGGTAAVLHGSSTATYDLDIVMPFTFENCERLLAAVMPLHPRLSHTPDRLPLQLAARDLVTFRNLYLATDIGRLDVLGSLPPVGTAAQVLQDSPTVDIGGLRVRSSGRFPK